MEQPIAVMQASKKVKSGFCHSGWHEGTKPRTPSGLAAPTCKFFTTCSCKCHAELDKLFEMTEMPRILVENPEYKPFKRTWWMPSDDPLYGLRGDDDGDAQGPVGLVERTPTVPSFAPTATGQRARGQLEYEVLAIVHRFVNGELEDIEMLTPQVCAELIDKADPPSAGAIDAVWKRWVQLGFAIVGSKPTHFQTFSADGWMVGLEVLKDRAKKDKRKQEWKTRRGER